MEPAPTAPAPRYWFLSTRKCNTTRYQRRLRLLPPRILLVELLAQEDARKLAARRLWALELAVRNVVVKRFELVLGQPTGERAGISRGGRTVSFRSPSWHSCRPRTGSSGTAEQAVELVYVDRRLVERPRSGTRWCARAAAAASPRLFGRSSPRPPRPPGNSWGFGAFHALYLSEPGFPWPAALTHLSRSAGSFMS